MALNPSTLTREAGTSNPERRRRWRRPSLAHILIAVSALLAFALNFLALQDRTAVTSVAVAAVALEPGQRLDAGSTRLEDVPANLPGLEQLVTSAERDSLQGWIVTRHVDPGALLDQSALAEPTGDHGLRLMSIPVPVEHAAGDTIVVGERVDVIWASDTGARFIAADLEVTGLSTGDAGVLSSSGDYYIVVAIDAETALSVAEALTEGSIEVVRSTGAQPIPGGSRDGP